MDPSTWLASTPSPPDRYVLRLYVTGMSRLSAEAVAIVRRICDERLADRYQLDIIDLYRSPALAREDQIIATPTLVRQEPAPCKRLIGGLGDIQRVVDGLILAT